MEVEKAEFDGRTEALVVISQGFLRLEEESVMVQLLVDVLVLHSDNVPDASTDDFEEVDQKLEGFSLDVEVVDNSS